jgi:proteasome accessory factor B
VVNRRGHWYVAGHDRGRDGTRVFRMSRIDGPVKMAGPAGSVTVPAGADVGDLVKNWGASSAGARRQAQLRIRAGAGHGLRRPGAQVAPDPGHPGWDQVTVDFTDEKWYADYVASFGADVVVVGPPDLRESVIARLKGVLA